MNTIKEINHKGLIIHYTNLSNLSIDEAHVVMDEAVSVISKLPLNSVYSIVNIKGMRFNKELLNKVKEVGLSNAPYVKATAICGLSSMTKLIAKATIKLTGRRARICEDLEQSQEWLYEVSQR